MTQQQEDNTIHIGNPVEPRLCLYGDDSAFETTSAYAFVIFEQAKTQAASDSLRAIKKRYEIPETVPLHMRILFSGHARSKLGLTISREKIQGLLHDVVNEMNNLSFFLHGSYYRGPLPESPETDDAPDFRVTWSIKAMQSLLAKDALIRINFRDYKYSDMRIIVAEDPTRLPFLGKQRRQAHGWAGGSDIGAPQGFVFHFSPLVRSPSTEPLLQLADLFVYAIAHALEPANRNPTFPSLLQAVNNIDVQPARFKLVP